MELAMLLFGLYFLLVGCLFHLQESSEFFAYSFIAMFFLVFATIFHMASDTVEIKEGIEENNRGLWSNDRKMDIILDEFKKVIKNVNRKRK